MQNVLSVVTFSEYTSMIISCRITVIECNTGIHKDARIAAIR